MPYDISWSRTEGDGLSVPSILLTTEGTRFECFFAMPKRGGRCIVLTCPDLPEEEPYFLPWTTAGCQEAIEVFGYGFVNQVDLLFLDLCFLSRSRLED